VDHLLAPPDAAEYESLLQGPRTTIDAAHAWLTARGYALSRSAVARHRRRFLASRDAARAKAAESEQVLRRVLLAAKEAGPEGFAAACLAGHQLALFNFLMKIEHFDEFPADLYLVLTKAIALNIKAQRDVIEMQRRATPPRPDAPTPPHSRSRSRSRRPHTQRAAPAPAADDTHLTEAERNDALARKVWAILEPNRPIEMFLGEHVEPSDPEPGAERKA
jgi:hypothetical protein